MKAIHFSKYLFLLTAILFVSLPSCDKNNEDPAGPPLLSHVTAIKDTTQTFLTGGNMGDWIAIHGKNLATAYKIYFNDVEVDMEEVYYENEVLYLQIPIRIPLEVTDQLKVITKGGETSFTFTVGVPDLELTGMFNEYTLPGDTIKIYGKFLDLYEVDKDNTVVVFGDIQTPVIKNGGTFITAKVPVNVQANVKVKAINSKYSATAICPGYYQDKHSVITTFDDDFPSKSIGANWASIVTLVDEKTGKPLSSGKCIKLFVNQDNAPSGLGWWYFYEHIPYAYTADMAANPENYILKFELNMFNPINTTRFCMYYWWNQESASTDNYILKAGGDYLNVQTFRVWQTISIPFEVFRPKGKGNPERFSIRVESFAPVEPVHMYIDNFRIYKKGE